MKLPPLELVKNGGPYGWESARYGVREQSQAGKNARAKKLTRIQRSEIAKGSGRSMKPKKGTG
jgi:hypothetical protein